MVSELSAWDKFLPLWLHGRQDVGSWMGPFGAAGVIFLQDRLFEMELEQIILRDISSVCFV